MEDDTLTYLKAPCAEVDTLGRFFLSVRPVNVADIPENRREIGHDALNFDFAPDGIIFNGKCMIRRELPWLRRSPNLYGAGRPRIRQAVVGRSRDRRLLRIGLPSRESVPASRLSARISTYIKKAIR